MDLNEKPLVNRVAKSGILTLDLGKYFPTRPIVQFDLKDYLFKGLILKEKDFREALGSLDWSRFSDVHLLVYCSTDAIIPKWAYMLVASYASDYVSDLQVGSREEFLRDLMIGKFYDSFDPKDCEGKPVVIKGCGDKEVPAGVYAEAIRAIKPYAKKIMYGEPCSTVPVYSAGKVKRSLKK